MKNHLKLHSPPYIRLNKMDDAQEHKNMTVYCSRPSFLTIGFH